MAGTSDGARESQGMLQAKINLLRDKLARASIMDNTKIPKDQVAFGCTIVVKDLDFGDKEEFTAAKALANYEVEDEKMRRDITLTEKLLDSIIKKLEENNGNVTRTAADVTATMGAMKGAMMKLAQMLSYVDAGLPDAYQQVLAQLQEHAPPMAYALAAGGPIVTPGLATVWANG